MAVYIKVICGIPFLFYPLKMIQEIRDIANRLLDGFSGDTRTCIIHLFFRNERQYIYEQCVFYGMVAKHES